MVDIELKDDFIPNFDRKILLKQLLKLPLSTLCDLTLSWFSKFNISNYKDEAMLAASMEYFKKKKVRRRVLASKILIQYWPRGLNLYQIAQIESYLMIHKPNNYSWSSSTAWNASQQKSILNIDPQKFIRNLRRDLSKFYLTSLYIFKYPELPLIVCRVQLFDFNNAFLNSLPDRNSKTEILPSIIHKSMEKELVSRRPFYIAFPENSPTIIHSGDSDSYAQLILLSVQKTISEREPIIVRANDTSLVQSLESIVFLHGPSRYSESLGPWKSYADSSFDISPLSNTEAHMSATGKRTISNEVSTDDLNSSELKRIKLENTMMKFKGSKEGIRVQKIKELKNLHERTHNLNGKSSFAQLDIPTPYSSLIPVEKIEFTLINELPEMDGGITIKFKFKGNDVFGGLHELCDNDLIDISKVPGWLTGENGISSGTIYNGDFLKDSKRKGGLL